MGTRNVMTVILNKQVKVRQYCQWDGYPTGQGADIAEFIQSADMGLFKSKVANLKFLSIEQVRAKLNKLLGHDNEWITMKEGEKINKYYPAMSRDTGSKLLGLIQKGRVKEVQDCGISKNDMDIEYIYEINLDNQTVTVKTNSYNGNLKKKYKFKDFTMAAMRELEAKINEEEAA
jgi:hypothetical protein